jgi:hypothetical protein
VLKFTTGVLRGLMINRIYKSRAFRRLIYFFIAVILNGCYSDYTIRKLDSSEIDASSILKVYLNDGRTVDFKEKGSPNTLISLNENELTYKNYEGIAYKLLKHEIERVYNERFSIFNTILCGVGIIALIFAGLIIAIAIKLQGRGFAG